MSKHGKTVTIEVEQKDLRPRKLYRIKGKTLWGANKDVAVVARDVVEAAHNAARTLDVTEVHSIILTDPDLCVWA